MWKLPEDRAQVEGKHCDVLPLMQSGAGTGDKKVL